MRHANGFTYFHHLTDPTPRGVQWLLWQKAEARNPALTEMEEIPVTGWRVPDSGFTVYLGGKTYWERKHLPLVRAEYAKVTERARRLQPRLVRAMEHVAQRNREHLASLLPEQALAAFRARESSCLHWYEVLPPGITQQAACDAVGLTFTVDHGWQHEGGRSVKRHTTFAPDAKPRKGFMVASRI